MSRIEYINYKDYLNRFDFLYDTFAKENVLKGSLEKYNAEMKNKKGTESVDIDFLKRIFYYISKNIVNELTLTAGSRQEGEDYKQLSGIISINLLNFNLDFGDEGKPHRCFKLIDTKNHNIDLDFIQMHIIEVKRFVEIIKNSTIEELKKNKLLTWIKFFTSDNLDLIENELKEANPIMTKAIEEYKKFTSDEKMMRAYYARDAFLVGQKMMLNRERKEGIKEGKLEGIKNEKYSIAKTLKQMNMDDASISKATGLSIEEVQNINADGEKL